MSLIRELFFESWKDHEPKDAERKAVQCPPDGVLAKRDIVYLQQDDHTELMDIFFPEKAKGMLPVIVDVHGGGWVYGNKELNEYYCMELAKLGFVVCDINYRLCPVTDLKGQVQDVTAALQWIFDHIHQYVGDSEQISVTGDSAGAQLAFLVCAASANEAYRRSYEITSLSKPIKALGLTCPVSCLHEMMSTTMNTVLLMFVLYSLTIKSFSASILLLFHWIFLGLSPSLYSLSSLTSSDALFSFFFYFYFSQKVEREFVCIK